ncbi:DNA topoisomerase 1 beta [Asimina triloba]
MAVHGCVNQNHFADDDEMPLVFKRSGSTSKQNQLNAALKKQSSQRQDGSSVRPVSDARGTDDKNSSLPKPKLALSVKASAERLADAKSGASMPDRSKDLSKRESAANDREKKPPNNLPVKSADDPDDDSDDNVPLSCRMAITSAGQKNNSSSVSKDGSSSMPSSFRKEKSTIIRKPPDDSDDEKPLSSKLARSSGGASAVTCQSELSNPSSSYIKKAKIILKKPRDDSDDEKPLSSKLARFGDGASAITWQDSDNPSILHKEKTKVIIKKPPADSDDEKPLSSKLARSADGASAKTSYIFDESSIPSSSHTKKTKIILKKPPDDSDDDKPLSAKLAKSGGGASAKAPHDSNDKKPISVKFQQNGYSKKYPSNEQSMKSGTSLNKRPAGEVNSSSQSISAKKPKLSNSSSFPKIKEESQVKKEETIDDDDHIPIAQRLKKSTPSDNRSSIKKSTKVVSSSFKKNKKQKKVMKDSKYSKTMKVPPGSGGGQKWTTLEHNGVIFPPPYKPHGVKMLYNGQQVDLTPEQEEVATMFAVMKDTEYATKKTFIDNFMNDWRPILGKNHIIKKFELCDFTPIYEWHQREKEKKKQMSTEEKKTLKEEKLKQEEKYMWAIVDGVKEKVSNLSLVIQFHDNDCVYHVIILYLWSWLKLLLRLPLKELGEVGNFRVEPPGLFRGRGEHPKMGKLKRRIRPNDITINIGKGAPIPECPIPGQRWKEIKHDNTVTWLAFWNDPINSKESKYVFLAASSSLKGQSDKEKYEKARLLKDYIHGIRDRYTRDFGSKDATKRQIAVATYLIDKLALRAGNEKDDDEADTVGCCTLKVENVKLISPNKLQFDFLGKDSIRYFNTVEVEVPVYKAISSFQTGKKEGDDLFDLLDTSKLNAHLKELMPGLTAKVFRTYNASITLDVMLNQETKEGTVLEKIVVYQGANKQVAIICNHQRSVSKTHSAQMSRLSEKMDELKNMLGGLKVDLSRAKKGLPPLKDADGKAKKNLSPEAIQKKIAQTTAKIEKMELDMKIKEDLKTVALGTSKINYLDPRISVAWCKRHEVPIEKIFNKSLLAKFAWAMDVDPSFRF